MRISERQFDPHKVDGGYVLVFFTVSGKEHLIWDPFEVQHSTDRRWDVGQQSSELMHLLNWGKHTSLLTVAALEIF